MEKSNKNRRKGKAKTATPNKFIVQQTEGSNNCNNKKSNSLSHNQKGNNSDRNLDIIEVLRLIASFESVLGEIGPKIIDLFSYALSIEKNSNTSQLHSKILTFENCNQIASAVEILIEMACTVEEENLDIFSEIIKKSTNLLEYAQTYQIKEDITATNACINTGERKEFHSLDNSPNNIIDLTQVSCSNGRQTNHNFNFDRDETNFDPPNRMHIEHNFAQRKRRVDDLEPDDLSSNEANSVSNLHLNVNRKQSRRNKRRNNRGKFKSSIGSKFRHFGKNFI